MIRAKFIVQNVTNYAEGASVTLTPVVSGSEENKSFYKWTPGGKIELSMTSNETAAKFIPGKAYYVDFQREDQEVKEEA